MKSWLNVGADKLRNWVKTVLMRLEDERTRAERIEYCTKKAELKAETALKSTMESHARVIAAIDKLDASL